MKKLSSLVYLKLALPKKVIKKIVGVRRRKRISAAKQYNADMKHARQLERKFPKKKNSSKKQKLKKKIFNIDRAFHNIESVL